MKSVEDATANNNAVGGGWFKIFSEDYDSSAGKWCTEKLIDNDGHLSVTIPSDLAGGYYLVRPELLALQQADKTPADPQFYVGCAQIFLTSSGSSTPQDTVEIPGYISFENNNAAMTFSIYDQPMKLPYPMFGPPVYTSTSKRSLSPRSVQQTEGLVPANCVLENVNWCGIELASYSDQAGCWNSSEKCWDQATTCYAAAGPTGSKNCPIWETKCKGIQAACNAGNFNGPPDAGKILTPPLDTPDTLPAPAAYTGEDTSGSSAASGGSSSSATTSAAAVASPVSTSATSSSNAGTSVDTCGSNGGLTCVAGMCCSSHGYCGTSSDYCGTGCQGGFGTCSSAGMRKGRRGQHLGMHIRRQKYGQV